jgi:hypothetical protein
MNNQAMLTLKAELAAATKRITDHKPLQKKVAIEKVRTFAAECGLTEDDLFAIRNEWEDDLPPQTEPYWEPTPFADFCHPDTFGYTFIAELEEQRDAIRSKIASLERERRNEAIERVRAFIKEYKLTKEDIYGSPTKAKSQRRSLP